MEKKIKMVESAKDIKTGNQILSGTVIDLGKERNTNAVNNGLAVWVDSRDFTEAKKEVEADKAISEKKEVTPKKTTTSAKGKKIETK